MKTACSLIREQPHYRADAFRLGLKRSGLSLTDNYNTCDVLVVWNRYGWRDEISSEVEKRGGIVLVVENGYLGNDFAGDRWYSMAVGGHNGAGLWPHKSHHPHEGMIAERWDSLGIEIAPWQNGDGPIIVLPQRGIGPIGVAMPNGWTERICAQLNRDKIKHRVRQHPGKQAVVKDLAEDLAGARAVLTWGSGAALKALLYGVPAYYEFERWIGAPAASRWSIDRSIDGPIARATDSRLQMFRRLAHAMWRISEIESGEAITTLMELK